MAHGQSRKASVCSGGWAGCDDGLGEQCQAMQGVVVAALTDAGIGEVRLVKVVELSIQQDDGLLSGIAEFSGEKD